MNEMIEIKLEDFQRLAEENDNLQKMIVDKNQIIAALENRLTEINEKNNTD